MITDDNPHDINYNATTTLAQRLRWNNITRDNDYDGTTLLEATLKETLHLSPSHKSKDWLKFMVAFAQPLTPGTI